MSAFSRFAGGLLLAIIAVLWLSVMTWSVSDPSLTHATSGVTRNWLGPLGAIVSDQPGIQFYTGNFLKDQKGKGGATYQQYGGFCLETQYYPDSIHHPSFPSPILKPGDTYRHTMIHRFSTA